MGRAMPKPTGIVKVRAGGSDLRIMLTHAVGAKLGSTHNLALLLTNLNTAGGTERSKRGPQCLSDEREILSPRFLIRSFWHVALPVR